MGQPKYKYDFSAVARAASGNWSSIIQALSKCNYDWSNAIAKADRRSKSGNPCPVHGGKDGFRLFHDFHETGGAFSQRDGAFSDGFKLLSWINDEKIGQVLEEVAEFLAITPKEKETQKTTKQTRRKPKKQEIPVDLNAIKRIRQVWSETVPVNLDDPVDKYFINRGIEIGEYPECIRLHKNLPYFVEDENNNLVEAGRYPALILQVTNAENQTVSLHRIYLNEDGTKATIPGMKQAGIKKMMSPYKPNGTTGAAIKFFKPEGSVLALAEGPETALAVHLATGLPTWSCVNAYLLSKVDIPDNIKHVVIYADKDLSGTGQNAAIELHERLMLKGIIAAIRIPKGSVPKGSKSIDWLDIWKHEGIKGFKK